MSAVETLDSRSQVLLIISGTCVGTCLFEKAMLVAYLERLRLKSLLHLKKINLRH